MSIAFVLINFIILAVVLVLVAGKMVKGIFQSRLDRVNSELDLAEQPVEEKNFQIPEDNIVNTISDLAVEEINRSTEQDLELLAQQHTEMCENLRKEMLLRTRTDLVGKVIEKARYYMGTEQFQSALAESEDEVVDRILSRIRLTPGDHLYIANKGHLYITLTSSSPLKEENIAKIKDATDALLQEIGAVSSFRVLDHEEDLLGGIRLRIGDTVYDYTVADRLYRLKEALNNMPLTDTDADSMLKKMESAVSGIDIDVDIFQLGRVLTVSDGICWLDGLSDIMFGELVEFVDADKPMYGMVMDIQPERIGCIIFGRFEHVDSYSRVRRLGEMFTTPVGEEFLGRVVNPLGEPIDGKGRIWESESRPVEFPAPTIPQRKSVDVPLETGLKAIDSLVPIGRGQRELIIGDRGTGKTSIALDAIINQKGKNVRCIYVAIGQKESRVSTIASKLESYGAMEYTTIVCSSASDSASLLYIAPFVGCAMAEYFMYKGQDVLIIYDDLSKHAIAYRELSLLLHRPAGREAFPGDIFYLHSRLLERAARLSEEYGGGSITALPIIETQAGDISAYIPTNVISITDGQIFLESELFNAGQRPAVNVGLSVSRVGGSAQTPLMKQVSASLRTSLAQYREFAAFMQFGSEVDESTRKILDAGQRMTAALQQPCFSPMPTWQQAAVIYGVNGGASAPFSVDRMNIFEKEFLAWLSVNQVELCDLLKTGNKMSEETKTLFDTAIQEFVESIQCQASHP